MSKPTMLVMDEPKARSPLLTQFESYLGRPNGPFDTVISCTVHLPIDVVIKDRMNGKPDYIYWGHAQGTSLSQAYSYVNRNKIPIIVDMGDPYLFIRHVGYTNNFWKLKTIKFLVARWSKSLSYPLEKDVRAYMEYGAKSRTAWIRYHKVTSKFLNDVELLHVPWAIDTSNMGDVEGERDIDVCFMCTRTDRFPRHDSRREALKVLEGMDDLNIVTGRLFGDDYSGVIRRSKIMIVEGSGLKFMTQKYLEGAIGGAMLIGDVPFMEKRVFRDGETIGEVNDFSKIEPIIRRYLKNDKERVSIAGECQRRVAKKFSLQNVVGKFERRLLEEINV